MKVKVTIIDENKEPVTSAIIDNVSTITPMHMEDRQVYDEGFDEVDPNGMYLIFTHKDGSVGTYRASYVIISDPE